MLCVNKERNDLYANYESKKRTWYKQAERGVLSVFAPFSLFNLHCLTFEYCLNRLVAWSMGDSR